MTFRHPLRPLHHLELGWHYRCIARIEKKVRTLTAAELRKAFAAETVATLDGNLKKAGVARPERRRMGRQIAKGR